MATSTSSTRFSTEVAETVERDHRLDGLKRQFMLLTLPLVSVAALAEWVIHRPSGGPISALLLIGAVVPFGLDLLLWWKRRSLRFVETVILAGVGAAMILLLYEALFSTGAQSLERFTTFYPWVTVSMAAIFLVLGNNRATWVASIIYLGMLALGVIYIVTTKLAGEQPVLTGPLLQFYLSNAVLICLLVFYGQMRHQYERTRSLARSMSTLAHTDPLLGIPNRRQLHALIQQEVQLAEYGGAPATLIMFDLDRFKQVNDTFGHEAGDQVLQTATVAVRQTLRAADKIGRWGGDEFIVLVQVENMTQAHQLAQRLGEAVHQRLSERCWRVTISLGVAQYQPGDTVESWVNRADQAMYQAKQTGRNRVVVG